MQWRLRQRSLKGFPWVYGHLSIEKRREDIMVTVENHDIARLLV